MERSLLRSRPFGQSAKDCYRLLRRAAASAVGGLNLDHLSAESCGEDGARARGRPTIKYALITAAEGVESIGSSRQTKIATENFLFS